MRLNNWSIAASYDTARIFAGFLGLALLLAPAGAAGTAGAGAGAAAVEGGACAPATVEQIAIRPRIMRGRMLKPPLRR